MNKTSDGIWNREVSSWTHFWSSDILRKPFVVFFISFLSQQIFKMHWVSAQIELNKVQVSLADIFYHTLKRIDKKKTCVGVWASLLSKSSPTPFMIGGAPRPHRIGSGVCDVSRHRSVLLTCSAFDWIKYVLRIYWLKNHKSPTKALAPAHL